MYPYVNIMCVILYEDTRDVLGGHNNNERYKNKEREKEKI